MTERRKRNIVIGALCGVLLLMVVGYAAFSSILNIKGTTNISSNWDIRITNVESKNVVGSASNAEDPEWDNLTATFKTNLEVPGDSIEYDVTVENKGTLNAKLDKITLSDTKNPAIKFTATGLTEGDKLNAGSSAVLTVKVEYLTGVEVDNKNLSANLTVTLDYVQSNVGEGGIATIPGSDTLLENVVTEGDGLYEDSTEAGRYVYRGINPNNYITFNGEEAGWRIISVETDGTLKIMKTDSLGDRAFDTTNGRYQGSSGYCNNNRYGCNVWGSASTMLDASGNNVETMPRQVNSTAYTLPTEESPMTKYLNSDYYGTLTDESKSQIDTHLWNVGPLLNTNQTLETSVTQEKAYKWRGKVGLINPSDYVKATTNTSCTTTQYNNTNCKNSNYMYNSSISWWTMSPYSDSGSDYVWFVYSTGNLSINLAITSYGVRPVIYLTSDISLSGSGTASDPYTIS